MVGDYSGHAATIRDPNHPAWSTVVTDLPVCRDGLGGWRYKDNPVSGLEVWPGLGA